MRIIAGKHGGRKFYPPAKMPARPTTDIAKEGLFNILNNMIDFTEIKSLDLFGGTGSISYELVSRGCENITIVEQDAKLNQFIKQTFADLKFENYKIFKMDVFQFLSHCNEKFDFIFAGPPYALKNIDEIYSLIYKNSILNHEGLFVLEHTPANNYEGLPYFKRCKNYGTTLFSFFVFE